MSSKREPGDLTEDVDSRDPRDTTEAVDACDPRDTTEEAGGRGEEAEGDEEHDPCELVEEEGSDGGGPD